MALEREMDRLRGVPVFACLDGEALRLLAFSAEPRRLAAGEVLFRKGTPATGATLVVSGSLSLVEDGADGASAGSAGPGTLLDETALLAESLHRTTATVSEPAVVITVSRASLLRALEAYPANAVPLRRYWAGRLARRLGRLREAVRP